MARKMKKATLNEVVADLPKYLQIAETEDVVILRQGKPAGILVGLSSDDEWFEHQLLDNSNFQKRIENARENLRQGKGIRIEDISFSD